ncbi:MAG: hypothetical protein IKG56_00505 [Clostridia bacterium]|nr:hypothetical protein [Clostridia bacterium]
MKHKFLQDLGIDIEEDTKDVLKQFNLNGFLDEISDNRLKEEEEKVEELKEEIENSEKDVDNEDNKE